MQRCEQANASVINKPPPPPPPTSPSQRLLWYSLSRRAHQHLYRVSSASASAVAQKRCGGVHDRRRLYDLPHTQIQSKPKNSILPCLKGRRFKIRREHYRIQIHSSLKISYKETDCNTHERSPKQPCANRVLQRNLPGRPSRFCGLLLVMKILSSLPFLMRGCLYTWRCVSSPQSKSQQPLLTFNTREPVRLRVTPQLFSSSLIIQGQGQSRY